jgi:toxin ParE1/3/4
MGAELILAPEVEHDLAEAYAWYEKQRSGLGEDFLSCVAACTEDICRMPEKHAKIHEHYRRGLVRRFPYAVFFEYTEAKVIVYCVIHTARAPDKWRERLP